MSDDPAIGYQVDGPLSEGEKQIMNAVMKLTKDIDELKSNTSLPLCTFSVRTSTIRKISYAIGGMMCFVTFVQLIEVVDFLTHFSVYYTGG